MIVIEKYFLWFMFYSIIGWMYESLICSVDEKRFINRGFLNGPYCPIYGCGAILDILILGKIDNAFLLFFLGALVTCTLEYITSVLMEKMFNARWWDYSKRKFNINGRICLLGAIVFGAFSVLLIKVVHPFISEITELLPNSVFDLLVALLLLVFLIDIIITFSGFAGFNNKLKEIASALDQANAEIGDKIRDISSKIPKPSSDGLIKKFNWQHRRMISAFPRMKSVKYDNVLTEIKNHLKKKK